MWFNVHLEVNKREPDVDFDELLERLQGLHPAVGVSPRSWVQMRISLQTDTLRNAATLAMDTATAATGGDVLVCEAMTEDEFAAREGYVPMPELIGVSDAAQMLGVTRQRVLQYVDDGRLHGQKVGNSYCFPRASVEAWAEAHRAMAAEIHERTKAAGNAGVK